MKELGIEPILLLAQIINFGIIFFVLKKFLSKPILNMLDKRKQEIEEGLNLTRKMQAEEEKLKEKSDKVVSDAKKEARALLEEAKKQATEQRQQIVADAHKEAAQVIAKGKLQAEQEVKAMEEKVKQQVVDLASAMVAKLLPEVMSDKDHQKLLSSQLKDLEKNVTIVH